MIAPRIESHQKDTGTTDFFARSVAIHAVGNEMTDPLRRRLDRVDAAIDDRVPLQIYYVREDGAGSERIIRPLALWFWGKVWTLISWCELRNDFRMFRLDRIVSIEEQGTRFKHERGKTLQDFYRLESHIPH